MTVLRNLHFLVFIKASLISRAKPNRSELTASNTPQFVKGITRRQSCKNPAVPHLRRKKALKIMSAISEGLSVFRDAHSWTWVSPINSYKKLWSIIARHVKFLWWIFYCYWSGSLIRSAWNSSQDWSMIFKIGKIIFCM